MTTPSIRPRRLVLLLAVLAVAALGATVTAAPATAAPTTTTAGAQPADNSGGCGTLTVVSWGSWRACISKSGSTFIPDGYLHLAAGHPSCTATVVAVNTFGARSPGRSTACPAGAVGTFHVLGNTFTSSDTWFTLVYVNGVAAQSPPQS